MFLSGCTFVAPVQDSPIVTVSIPAPTSTPVTLELPKVISFIASPPNISSGQSVVLTWQTENATSITIQPGVGNVSTSGTKEVTPASTTKYTLTASSENGTVNASQEVVVNIASITPQTTPTPQKPTIPVINYFTVNPSHIMAGSAITLTWSITNATQITIDNDEDDIKYTSTKDTDDMVAHPVIDTVYRIVAKNSAGTAQATVVITIDPSVANGDEGGSSCG